ncbi:MAG TPA: transcriptional regulator PdhR [Oceanospirillaceae bacterium]|nr:transcriptional regulator PdhR [Oceanospirillaceae bacterium]
MSFSELTQPKVADVIIDHLEQMIVEGSLHPGQPLPSERDLAMQLKVSRPSLREAIKQLVERGLLVSKHGGGTQVSEVAGLQFNSPLTMLLLRDAQGQEDLLEFRHTLEGNIAYLAAKRATDLDKTMLTQAYQRLQDSHASDEGVLEADADAHFHLTIAAACHNRVLLHTMRALFDVLSSNVHQNLVLASGSTSSRHEIRQQHKDLYDNIINGQAEAARSAAHAHMNYLEQLLHQQNRHTQRRQTAARHQSSWNENNL